MQAGGQEFESLHLHSVLFRIEVSESGKLTETRMYLENCILNNTTSRIEYDISQVSYNIETKDRKIKEPKAVIMTLHDRGEDRWFLREPYERSSNVGRRADALALRADERRDKLR